MSQDLKDCLIWVLWGFLAFTIVAISEVVIFNSFKKTPEEVCRQHGYTWSYGGDNKGKCIGYKLYDDVVKIKRTCYQGKTFCTFNDGCFYDSKEKFSYCEEEPFL